MVIHENEQGFMVELNNAQGEVVVRCSVLSKLVIAYERQPLNTVWDVLLKSWLWWAGLRKRNRTHDPQEKTE